MTQRKVSLKEATRDELREFGQNTLGLEMPGNISREAAVAKVQSAWQHEHILLDGDPLPPAAQGLKPQPVLDKHRAPAPGKVRVLLEVREEVGGSDPVPVGVNGKIMLIPRGEECDIPFAYFEVLKHATKHIFDPIKDGGISVKPRIVLQYPFSVIAMGEQPERTADQKAA